MILFTRGTVFIKHSEALRTWNISWKSKLIRNSCYLATLGASEGKDDTELRDATLYLNVAAREAD